MGTFAVVGLASRLWPRLVAVIIAAVILLSPHTAIAVFDDAIQTTAGQMTALLDKALNHVGQAAERPKHPAAARDAGERRHRHVG